MSSPDKRRASQGYAEVGLITPVPDGSVQIFDRRQVAGIYPGPVTWPNVTGSGGLTSGGAATVAIVVSVVGSGGLTSGGAAVVVMKVSLTGSGGLVFGGTALVAYVKAFLGSGGLTFGGAAEVVVIIGTARVSYDSVARLREQPPVGKARLKTDFLAPLLSPAASRRAVHGYSETPINPIADARIDQQDKWQVAWLRYQETRYHLPPNATAKTVPVAPPGRARVRT